MTLISLSPAGAPSASATAASTITKPGAPAAGPSFTDRLGSAIDSLAQAQTKASSSAAAYELGQQQDLAAVMVDQQVASLGFQLALNLRNKALGAYRDIMNMSV